MADCRPIAGGAYSCAKLFMSCIIAAGGVSYAFTNDRELFKNLTSEYRGTLPLASHDRIFLEHCGITQSLVSQSLR
jgi:hypothetical protein